jgi:hypothetical protein
VEGGRDKHLLRRRGDFLERPLAHQYETGALRRVHVRGRKNVAKRVLLQAAAFNLALILRSITKAGTPRGRADLKTRLLGYLLCVLAALGPFCEYIQKPQKIFPVSPLFRQKRRSDFPKQWCRRKPGSDMGC